MRYEFAPMEGITGFVFRNAHHRYFPSMDRYYTPFLTPKQGKGFTVRESRDVAPEHNEGIRVVPQVLTNSAEGFCRAAGWLESLGYEEVNLNLGCPSRTVVTKYRGSGFLAKPGELDAFFAEVEGAALAMDCGGGAIELTAPGAGKLAAVTFLAGRLGLTLQDVMAIGDSGNDAALLAAAGLGVAMGNAPAHVQQAARAVTGRNTEGGAAQAIRRWLLEG